MYASRPRLPLVVYTLRSASGVFERFVISRFPPLDAERLFSTRRRALARAVVRILSPGLRTASGLDRHPVVLPWRPTLRALSRRPALSGRRVIRRRPPGRNGRGAELRRYAA